MSSIGETIRAARQAKGRSLRKVAEAVGISTVYLSEIERGTRKATVPRLLQLAKELDEPEAYFAKAAIEDRLSPLLDDRRKEMAASFILALRSASVDLLDDIESAMADLGIL